MRLVINDAEIVVRVAMFAIGLNGAFETLLVLIVALHHELADRDLVEHRRAPRRTFQCRLVVVDRVEEVFLRAQFVPALFQLLGRWPGSGWIDAVQRRRTALQLLGVLCLQWENEESSEEKCYRADADPGKHINPRPNASCFQITAAACRCHYP